MKLAFALTLENQAILDTFAIYVKKYPDLIFELSGHTDSIGKDNIALSQKRVQAVHTYLTEVLKIPTYRFYTRAMGGDTPYRPNTTEAGRILNRRTEIRQSTLTLASMFYRAAPLSVIFVLLTLHPPATLWSFDQAHTTCDANQLIINPL